MARRAAKAEAVDPQAAIKAKFIDQGSDPVIAKKALDDATAVSRALWLSFLTFGTYLVITFAGVTHRDLLLEEPITLPVLNAKLPLVTFFWVAPILFVIFHLYLLLSLKLLADQVHHYVQQMEELGLDGDAQDRARLQLPNFVIVQVLGGTNAQVNSFAGWLMRFTAWLTLAAGPIILLLFAQLMFLPYHGWGVTMAQRLTVVIDLVFIWYFWWAIKRPQREGPPVLAGVASAAVVATTFLVFMYPGELFYGPLPKAVFKETGSVSTPFGLEALYNTLVLPGERLVEEELYDKLEARNKAKGLMPWQGERSIRQVLVGRDFRSADFAGTDLRKVDLQYSILDGTNLYGASLQGADIKFASLNGASLTSALLIAANLGGASLNDALLDNASLQGADLTNASLGGASLEDASLQGALLIGSWLHGAWLRNASLQGVTLNGASLQGSVLEDASLQGASLDGALMQAAALYDTSLQGASLNGTQLQGASLRGAVVLRNPGSPDLTLTDTTELSVPLLGGGITSDNHGLTKERYEKILQEALDRVPEFRAGLVRKRIALLDPSTQGPVDAIDWLKVRNEVVLPPDFKSRVIRNLIETACYSEGRPFVAQGIIAFRFDPDFGDLGKESLPLVDALLGDDCPGAEGMDQGTIERLKELKKQFTTNGAAPKHDGVT